MLYVAFPLSAVAWFGLLWYGLVGCGVQLSTVQQLNEFVDGEPTKFTLVTTDHRLHLKAPSLDVKQVSPVSNLGYPIVHWGTLFSQNVSRMRLVIYTVMSCLECVCVIIFPGCSKGHSYSTIVQQPQRVEDSTLITTAGYKAQVAPANERRSRVK